jgi:hypothetical protein
LTSTHRRRGVSYAIENTIENKKGNISLENKENNSGGNGGHSPDRSGKFFKGKYGSMVNNNAEDLKETDPARAERMKGIEAPQ